MSSTAPRTRDRKSPAERTQSILDTATELALEDGLTALTLRAVAARAGVAPGLISHYFSSIDDVVAQVHGGIAARELDEVRALLDAVSAPEARMNLVIESLLDPSRDEATVVWVESWALARRNAQLADVVHSQAAAWNRLIESIIDDGIAAGVFDCPDAVQSARQVLGMIDGINAQTWVSRDDVVTDATLVKDAVSRLLGVARG